MSTSYGRDSVNFEFYIANRKNMYQKAASGLAAYQAIMQLLVTTFFPIFKMITFRDV